MRLSQSTYDYQPTGKIDEQIKEILKELADKYKRYGFRKIFCMIRRKGFPWNHKRVYRVYCSLGLNIRKKPKRRLVVREKVILEQPTQLNASWSLDYMSDALIHGKRFRTVNVIDDCNREVLTIKARLSLPSRRVIEILEEVAQEKGYPTKIRVDNGPENISQEFKQWAKSQRIELEYIQPGKPAQNGYIERFNRTYREEVLDMNLFRNIQEVQQLTDQWIREYNNERPHQALGNLTPREYGQRKNFSTFRLY